jgi:hypothetical protein
VFVTSFSSNFTPNCTSRQQPPPRPQPSTTPAKRPSEAGLQTQVAEGLIQAGCRRLVPKSRLESTVNMMVQPALEPDAYGPLPFWHLHDRLQQGFDSRPDNPIMKIIVKTRLKRRSEAVLAASRAGTRADWAGEEPR